MEHGKFTIEIEQDYIVIRLIGAFNFEGMTKYVEAIKKAIAQINSTTLNLIINQLEFEGAGPDAINLIDNYNEWLNCHYIVNKAFVGTQGMYQYIAEHKMVNISKQRFKFFDDETQAISWIMSVGQ